MTRTGVAGSDVVAAQRTILAGGAASENVAWLG